MRASWILLPLLICACPSTPLPGDDPDAGHTAPSDAGHSDDGGGGGNDAGSTVDGGTHGGVSDAGTSMPPDAAMSCNPCVQVRSGFPVTLPEVPARLGALAMANVSGDAKREIIVLMDQASHERAVIATVTGAGVMTVTEYPGGAAPSGLVLVDVNDDNTPDAVWGDFSARLRAHPFTGVAPSFPRTVGPAAPLQGLLTFRDPTLNDDVLVFSLNANLFRHAVHGAIVDGWPVQGSQTAFVDGVVACELNGDPTPEIAGVISEGSVFRMAAWDRTGTLLPGFPSMATVGPSVFPPTCLNVDGAGMDVIAFGETSGMVHVFGADGAERSGFPVQLGPGLSTQLSAGDLDGDGRPELVGSSPAHGGSVVAVDRSGQVVTGFPATVGAALGTTVILADVDGDGRNDALGVTADGNLTGVDASGRLLPGMPLALGAAPVGAPALDELDGDGAWDIAVVLENRRLVVLSLAAGSAHPQHAPWVRYRGRDDRSGRYKGEPLGP